MAKKLELRSVTPEEERELRKFAASRTAPARRVERAKILVTMLDEPEIGAMGAGRRAGLILVRAAEWAAHRRGAPGRSRSLLVPPAVGGILTESRRHTRGILPVDAPQLLAYLPALYG